MATDSSNKNLTQGDRSLRLPFHRRLFIGLLIYSAAIFTCFAIYLYQREKEFRTQQVNTELQNINDNILRSLSQGISPDSINKYITHSRNDLRISIFDRAGHIIYDNSPDSLNHGKPIGDEIAQAINNGESYASYTEDGKTYLYSAKSSSQHLVRTALPYSISFSHTLSPSYSFIWIFIGIITIVLIIGFYATRRIGRHVSRLSQFADRAERSERIADTEAFPNDELGRISHNIVRLYSRLQQAMNERDREHARALRATQDQSRIKRQLTNNINHELKTPVASMQICLEMLQTHPDLPDEKRNELIKRCAEANQRLAGLLADVAIITRLEDGAENIKREQVNLVDIINEVCDEYRTRTEDANISIEKNLKNKLLISGNSTILGSVFRNLIANAIAYAECSTIKIDSTYKNDKIIIHFTDNGNGVDDEHLPHLFERFYRVDKGRSRQAGGTGLGLAIVKNAILWHHGTISVSHPRGSGLSFAITLPATQA